MKKLFLLANILFLILNIHSEALYKSLINEGDYYRAAGAYKEYAFKNNLYNNDEYYLTLVCIYALSDFTDIATEYSKKAIMKVKNKKDFDLLSVIRSYLLFKQGSTYDALFEIESFNDNDSLKISLKFLSEILEKEEGKIYIIPQIFPENIADSVKLYLKTPLKDPNMAYALSYLLTGAGEIYANDNKAAIRDFAINTISLGIMTYAFIKNKSDWSTDKFEWTKDYFLKRDWVLTILVYSNLITRFQNGSRVNAMNAAYEYNEKIYEKYLSSSYYFIENMYKNRILNYIMKR